MGGRTSWKPESYSSVSPYLVVAGALKVVDFAKAVFGAIELRRYDLPDGSIMHAEIRIDDTVVMLGDGGPDFPPFPSLIHVYVDDVDRVYERGISVEAPRTREGDPDKRGSVTDPCGNTWAIATQLPESSSGSRQLNAGCRRLRLGSQGPRRPAGHGPTDAASPAAG